MCYENNHQGCVLETTRWFFFTGKVQKIIAVKILRLLQKQIFGALRRNKTNIMVLNSL